MNNIDKDVFNKGSNMTEQALRYNTGKAELSYILDAMPALKDMVAVMENGARKYSRNNWKKGFPREKLLDSMLRHVDAFYSGEDLDPESGLPHVGHILCNAMFLGYHNGSESKYWKDKYPEGVVKEEPSISTPDFKVGDRVKIVIPESLEVGTGGHQSVYFPEEPDGGITYCEEMLEFNGRVGKVVRFYPNLGYAVEGDGGYDEYTYLPEWLEKVED